MISSQGPAYSTTGISITSAVGDVFSNVQVGDASGHGFGTGLQISTTANAVFLDSFNQLYLRGNATNLLTPSNGNTTNENIVFNGGVLAGMGTYNQACANIGNFQMQFIGMSFDSCPVTIYGGGNTHIQFTGGHFESTLGSTTTDYILVSLGCGACSVSLDHSEFVENAGSARTEFVKINGSGLYDFIGPQVQSAETVNAFVTSTNTSAYVHVTTPFFFGGGTITYSVDPSGGYGSASVISNGAFTTGTQSCAFRYGLGAITGCQSFATLSASRTWTFPNASGTVGLTGNSVSGFYQSVKNTAGCTTGSSLGNGCASGSGVVTVTWPTTFADANYSVTCTGVGAPTGAPGPVYVVASTKLPPSIQFDYLNLGTVAAAYAHVDCIAVHD